VPLATVLAVGFLRDCDFTFGKAGAAGLDMLERDLVKQRKCAFVCPGRGCLDEVQLGRCRSK
jgi:hypothetical protein